MPSDPAFRFWDLPAELRNLVYTHLFAEETLDVSVWLIQDTYKSYNCYDKKWPHVHPLERFLVSKQFYKEALPVYLSTCTFDLNRLELMVINSRDFAVPLDPPSRLPLMRRMKKAIVDTFFCEPEDDCLKPLHEWCPELESLTLQECEPKLMQSELHGRPYSLGCRWKALVPEHSALLSDLRKLTKLTRLTFAVSKFYPYRSCCRYELDEDCGFVVAAQKMADFVLRKE